MAQRMKSFSVKLRAGTPRNRNSQAHRRTHDHGVAFGDIELGQKAVHHRFISGFGFHSLGDGEASKTTLRQANLFATMKR
jgi:hypothetical protein